ncbi:DDE-type integrase/transposase/recombinase [Candidatus Absconditicoccus praedator]|uniref:DDE-type integrase/transposase/recombinase n=1 Tax=Candidatus Absconditicoccus praedator TaxID=2735562 RepID=UPI001E4BC1A4|nr:DDE-type integrase/transposase/recombinase [Candidatus Absconditicoccus praedator]
MVVIIDWYSRAILSWELSLTLESEFCISALNRALALYEHPEIVNSDQGSQFTSVRYTNKLKENGIKISMDGKGRWIDNIIVERTFRTIKQEEVYIYDYRTPLEAYNCLQEYIDKYNQERLHSALNYKTPREIYGLSKDINIFNTTVNRAPFIYNV